MDDTRGQLIKDLESFKGEKKFYANCSIEQRKVQLVFRILSDLGYNIFSYTDTIHSKSDIYIKPTEDRVTGLWVKVDESIGGSDLGCNIISEYPGYFILIHTDGMRYNFYTNYMNPALRFSRYPYMSIDIFNMESSHIEGLLEHRYEYIDLLMFNESYTNKCKKNLVDISNRIKSGSVPSNDMFNILYDNLVSNPGPEYIYRELENIFRIMSKDSADLLSRMVLAKSTTPSSTTNTDEASENKLEPGLINTKAISLLDRFVTLAEIIDATKSPYFWDTKKISKVMVLDLGGGCEITNAIRNTDLIGVIVNRLWESGASLNSINAKFPEIHLEVSETTRPKVNIKGNICLLEIIKLSQRMIDTFKVFEEIAIQVKIVKQI